MSNRGRLGRVLLAALIALPLLLSTLFAAPTAHGQAGETEPEPETRELGRAGFVEILQVSGLIDPILADYVIDTITSADPVEVRAIVLQVNGTGAVVDDETLDELGTAIAESRIPVTMWVGPSNARARGAWVELAALTDRLAVASGARFGDLGAARLDPALGADWGAAGARLIDDTVGSDEARDLGIASFDASTIGDFLIALEDLGVENEIIGEGEDARVVAVTIPRFHRLSLAAGQLHTAASPPVAYLLFTIGLALLVFEFYTAGVGVAGVVGAAMFLLGCYGLWVLPVSLFAVIMLLVAMFAFSVDVQTGVPRFWTIVGVLALIVGTVTLYRDPASMSWIPMLVGIVGISFMMVTGMPTMVRTRFSTPTIGREWMIGQTGTAIESVDPDGVVSIDDALWKARTNRATPAGVGEAIRVVAVEGLVLEIEPVSGGARDYRERRSDRDAP